MIESPATSETRRPLARVKYLIETDADRTWYSFDVYTEDALDREVSRLKREYWDVDIQRYPVQDEAKVTFDSYHAATLGTLRDPATSAAAKREILARLHSLLDNQD